MYRQRRPPPPSSFEATVAWTPEVRSMDEEFIEFRPTERDAYVVIDEIVAERVGIVISAWPKVDEGGRLRFAKGAVTRRTYARGRLDQVLNRLRASAGQLRRPLRIGDAFWVPRLSGPPERWRQAIDVTRAARGWAKSALIRAVTYPAIAEPPSRPRPGKARRRRPSDQKGPRFPEAAQRQSPPPEPEGFSPGSVAPPTI